MDKFTKKSKFVKDYYFKKYTKTISSKMENDKPEEVNLLSKLIIVYIRVGNNGEHILHEQSTKFQDEFAEIETFEIGKSINLLNKSYKIENIIYSQPIEKREIIDIRNKKNIISLWYEIKISLHLEEL